MGMLEMLFLVEKDWFLLIKFVDHVEFYSVSVNLESLGNKKWLMCLKIHTLLDECV